VVVVPDIAAAVIVPDVTRYGEDLLELIAAAHLRGHLARTTRWRSRDATDPPNPSLRRVNGEVIPLVELVTPSRRVSMGSPLPWLWLLGAGVALIVGVIAFVVASGLTESPTYGAPASQTAVTRPADPVASAARPEAVRHVEDHQLSSG